MFSKLRLFDFKRRRFDMNWTIEDILIWGDEIGDSVDKCFVPIFLSADTNPSDSGRTAWSDRPPPGFPPHPAQFRFSQLPSKRRPRPRSSAGRVAVPW